METLAPGIHRWTAPHPEWRPRAEEVASYALVAGEALLLVDPLVPADADERATPLLAELDRMAAAAARVELLITIPYHTRSTEALRARFATERPTRIWGHANVRKRLRPETPLEVVPMGAAGTAAPIAGGAAEAYAIGRPRRSEHPVYCALTARRRLRRRRRRHARRAALLEPEQRHRRGVVPGRLRPTLAALAVRPIEHVLVAHGPPAVGDGQHQLARCLAAPPVEMY